MYMQNSNIHLWYVIKFPGVKVVKKMWQDFCTAPTLIMHTLKLQLKLHLRTGLPFLEEGYYDSGACITD